MLHETAIAKLATGTASMEFSVGGIPDLTAQDVAAAFGFVSGRVPDAHLGIHVVQAQIADDAIAKDTLERILPKVIWSKWFELDIKNTVSRDQINAMAKMMILELCQTGKFRDMPSSVVSAGCRFGNRTWPQGPGIVYDHVIMMLRNKESETRRMLRL